MTDITKKTIDELCALLKEFKTQDGNRIDLRERYGDDYSSIKGALTRLKVVEKTLSDGSKVHDIQMNFSEMDY